MPAQFEQRGIIIGDTHIISLRWKVNGVYTSFTGETINFELRATDGTVLFTATTGSNIVYSTQTVTDDRITITIPKAVTATFPRGTHKCTIVWVDNGYTMVRGKLNFIPGL